MSEIQPNLIFSAGEPYRSILKMLFDYSAPEEVTDPGLKKFLQSIRWQLAHLFIIYFQEYGNEKVIPTIVEFLLPRMDHTYSIRDLLYIIMLNERNSEKKKSEQNVFTQYVNELCKNQRKEFDLIVALCGIINNAIQEKEMLVKVNPDSKSAIDCCEHVVSYSVHILLSFNWNELLAERFTAARIINYLMSTSGAFSRTSSSQQGMIISKINVAFGKSDAFISLLNLGSEKSRYSKPEELILQFLFHRLITIIPKEKFERGFLGEKTYLSLISHILPDPCAFYTEEKEVIKKITEMKESEFNVPRLKLIISMILANLRTFELPVQVKILKDTEKFCENRTFMFHFLRDDPVFEAVCDYLSKPKYQSQPEMKKSLETFVLHYVKYYWKHKREIARTIFKEITKFQPDEYLHMINLIFDEIMIEPLSYGTDEGIYTAIQFVYLLEDSGIIMPSFYTDQRYIEIIGKLIIFLSEINVLYFWFPSYLPSKVPRDLSIGSDFEQLVQREGGVIRPLLKILLSCLMRACKSTKLEDKYKKFIMNLLSFFLFRRFKTYVKIVTFLNLKSLIPSDQPSIAKGPELTKGESLLGFILKGTVIQNKQKLIMKEKSLVYQKVVEDIGKFMLINGKKDIFESVYFRALFVICQINQVLIYMIFGIDSYKALPKEGGFATKSEEKMSYYTKKLVIFIGKLLKDVYNTKGGSENMKKILTDLYKDFINETDYSIENCISPLDGCNKSVLDLLRPSTDSAFGILLNTFGTSPGKSPPSPKNNLENIISPEKLANIAKFGDSALKCFTPICEYFCQYKALKMSKDDFVKSAVKIIISENYIIDVQAGLHKIISEDLVIIEKTVYTLDSVRPRSVRRQSNAKIQSKGYFFYKVMICKGIRKK